MSDDIPRSEGREHWRDPYLSLSPLDYRYWDKELAICLSEEAFTQAKLEVELALMCVLANRGVCDRQAVREMYRAVGQVTTAKVYEREKKTRHDLRALVDVIQANMSPEARRFVHMMATSYDIIDTANAYRYRRVVQEVVLPRLSSLVRELIRLSQTHADVVQVGRTHLQHAVPVTVGFMFAEYVQRLGDCHDNIIARCGRLLGKFSGAVGAYNASSMFFEDPEAFEREVLAQLNLEPAPYSTQTVPPEPLARLLSEVALSAGVMANLARDLRNLLRPEIAEFVQGIDPGQVGSSTMAHKINPADLEQVEGTGRIVASRIGLIYADQISDHQRDLTNSITARTYGEIFAYVGNMIDRLQKALTKLSVNPAALERNLNLEHGLIMAEPWYIQLAAVGHPNAHEVMKDLSHRARAESKSLAEVVYATPELVPYVERLTAVQRDMLSDPTKYTGIAAKKARDIANTWKERLAL